MSTGGSRGKRIVVLGGTSEIALSIAGALAAQQPRDVALLGRDPAQLEVAAESLRAGGCPVVLTATLDALDTQQHAAILAGIFEQLGGADLVLLAVGVLGERGGLPEDVSGAVELLRVNVVGAGSLLLESARLLRAQGRGTLVVLSSVAGERVRPSNVVYGASKSALDALALGLGDALHADGVRVLVVRPGFVKTRMTRGLAAAPLAVAPADVARLVVRGLDRGDTVIWAPAVLRWVMLAIRLMPRALLRRLPI